MPDEGLLSQLKRFIVGEPIPSHLAHHERLSRVTGLAVLSSDALSSVAYATEEILRVLVLAGAAALTFASPIAIVIEAFELDKPVTVYYTRDGSLPTPGSASFTGHAQFDIAENGNHIIACYTTDSDGREHYQAFPYTLTQ